MNICKQLFKTLMVFTTLMYCEIGHTTVGFSLQDFSLDITKSNSLAHCSVDINGLIKTCRDEMVTYNEKCCYDLQTVVGSITSHCESPKVLYDEANLVVMNTDDNRGNYTIAKTFIQQSIATKGDNFLSITIPNNNINIIVPHGVTIYQKDVTFNVTGNNVNLIVHGTMDNTQAPYNLEQENRYNYPNSLFYFHNKANVIIGATATINFDNKGHDPMFNLNTSDSSIILYPGCEINTTNYQSKEEIEDEISYRNTIKSSGTLYLNKYHSDHANENDYKKLNGKISQNMKIVFPTQTNTKKQYNYNQDYIKHFPGLHWIGKHGSDCNNSDYKFHDYGNDFNQYDTDLSIKFEPVTNYK